MRYVLVTGDFKHDNLTTDKSKVERSLFGLNAVSAKYRAIKR